MRPGAVATVMAAAGLLIAVTIVGGWSGQASGRLLALDLVVGVLAWAATPLLLWRPVAATVLLGLLAAFSPAATPPATMGALQVARQRRLPAAIVVGTIGLAAHAVQGAWRVNGGMSYGWWLVLITIAYGALLGWGAWAQAREALIHSLKERARRAEAEQGRRVAEARMLERRRIAREMHDVLAHRLSLLATFAGAMEYRPDSPPEQLSKAAGIVRAGVHQALEELRDVISLLRDDDQDGDDRNRPQPVLADMPRLVEESRAAGTTVLLHYAVEAPAEAPPAVARTAYRVVQEALTNARKHAPGQQVRLDLRGAPGIGLEIDVRNPLPTTPPTWPGAPASNGLVSNGIASSDPGSNGLAWSSFASNGPAFGWSGGAGLVGLTERVSLAGGTLDHDEADGDFHLHASIPWPP
ncbi:Signal transduction histidine kinase [Actinoplanes derwentensis]|uniref:histidine kinase n=1 Tax=Actinoplanes derwentensis TaxID=113562 RepID=A0A1H1TCN0_9ACTN|nr:Signal transduction histidine kinase [Actinoplanes derwentensis]